MTAWRFFDFVTANGRNVVKDWIDDQPVNIRHQLRAALNTRIVELELIDRPFDRPDGVGQLRGKPCKGLFELVLKVAKKQYRAIGYYGPGKREFTLLAGATERDGAMEPSTCQVAQARRASCDGSRAYVTEHRFD